MGIKEQIMEIIENSDYIKFINDTYSGCFKNVVLPTIIESDDDTILSNLLFMLASQSAIYDKLLDNIYQSGDKELIEKCREGIKNIFLSENNNVEV